MRAVVTGATGFIGRRLVAKLDQPVVLSRDADRAAKALAEYKVRAVAWQPESAPASAFEGADAVFHLAGDPVAEGRWTEKKKARIRDSRELGTRNLVAGLASLPRRPAVLVSSSGVDYYRQAGTAEIDESSPSGDEFLADVCRRWEREATAARELGMRVVPIRTGVVLGKNGGALAKMLTPFKLGLGSPLGSGDQYMPWIHIDDLVEMMLFAARDSSVTGPLNGTAPQPVTNREFTRILARVLGRPALLPGIPVPVLRVMFGEMADVLLASRRVVPRAALAAGFAFKFRELELALRDVLGRT